MPCRPRRTRRRPPLLGPPRPTGSFRREPLGAASFFVLALYMVKYCSAVKAGTVMAGRALGWRRGYNFLLLGTVATVALADWLFWGHVVGWTAGLFAAVLVGLLALRGGHFFRTRAGCVLLLGTAGLVVALVEEPGPLPLAMTALFVAMLSVLNRADAFGDVSAWVRRLRELFTSGLFRFFADNYVAVRWLARRPISAG